MYPIKRTFLIHCYFAQWIFGFLLTNSRRQHRIYTNAMIGNSETNFSKRLTITTYWINKSWYQPAFFNFILVGGGTVTQVWVSGWYWCDVVFDHKNWNGGAINWYMWTKWIWSWWWYCHSMPFYLFVLLLLQRHVLTRIDNCYNIN